MAPRVLPLLLAPLLAASVLAGCAGPPPANNDAPAGPSPPEAAAGLAIIRCSVTALVGAGAPGMTQGAYLTCPFDGEVPLDAYGDVLVEASFPDAPATATAFHLRLQSDGCGDGAEPVVQCAHAAASGTSPRLRLPAPPGFLAEHGDAGPRARASFEGAAAGQRIEVAVTLVPLGQALPEGHSAFA